jgi:hypothetical protein
MKVPSSIEDAFIPMELDDLCILQEQKKQRDRYWAMLYRARQDFLAMIEHTSLNYNTDSNVFFLHLKQAYGLQVETVDGKITSEYAVVDEKKYLLFLMKFGS